MLDIISNHSTLAFQLPFGLHKKGRVLVADDQPDFRFLYKRVLGLEGWDVIEARDGHEVLQLVIEEVPDVLVLDHNMPFMKGEEVIHRLRALDLDIPTVLITAAPEARSLALKLGLDAYLGKPFRPIELTYAVEKACRVRASLIL